MSELIYVYDIKSMNAGQIIGGISLMVILVVILFRSQTVGHNKALANVYRFQTKAGVVFFGIFTVLSLLYTIYVWYNYVSDEDKDKKVGVEETGSIVFTIVLAVMFFIYSKWSSHVSSMKNRNVSFLEKISLIFSGLEILSDRT